MRPGFPLFCVWIFQPVTVGLHSEDSQWRLREVKSSVNILEPATCLNTPEEVAPSPFDLDPPLELPVWCGLGQWVPRWGGNKPTVSSARGCCLLEKNAVALWIDRFVLVTGSFEDGCCYSVGLCMMA